MKKNAWQKWDKNLRGTKNSEIMKIQEKVEKKPEPLAGEYGCGIFFLLVIVNRMS